MRGEVRGIRAVVAAPDQRAFSSIRQFLSQRGYRVMQFDGKKEHVRAVSSTDTAYGRGKREHFEPLMEEGTSTGGERAIARAARDAAGQCTVLLALEAHLAHPHFPTDPFHLCVLYAPSKTSVCSLMMRTDGGFGGLLERCCSRTRVMALLPTVRRCRLTSG